MSTDATTHDFECPNRCGYHTKWVTYPKYHVLDDGGYTARTVAVGIDEHRKECAGGTTP